MTETETASGAIGAGRGGRMSRQRKRDAVLRLLRGEDLETVSRSLGVTAATLSAWRDSFLAAGEAALASRPTDGETLELRADAFFSGATQHSPANPVLADVGSEGTPVWASVRPVAMARK